MKKKRVDPKANYRSGGSEFTLFQSPFAHLDEGQLKEVVQHLGQAFSKEYEEGSTELRALIAELEPIMLLSALGLTAVMVATADEEDWGRDVFLQAHYELVHAMVLQSDPSLPKREPSSEDFAKVVKLAQQIHTGFAFKGLGEREPTSLGDKSLQLLAETARSHTQVVRNWAFPYQMERVTREILSRVDSTFKETYDIQATDVFDFMQDVIRHIEDGINEFGGKVTRVQKGKTVRQIAKRYFEEFPDLEGTPDEFEALIRKFGGSARAARYLVLLHSNLRLPGIFQIDIDTLLTNDKKPLREPMRHVLNKWAASIGSVAYEGADRIMLGNPVWTRFLIAQGNSTFFCPNIGIYANFMLEAYEVLVEAEDTLRRRYEGARAQYLEDETERLFTQAFPTARAFRNSQWDDPVSGRRYENDLLILIDQTALVIENKSARVSAPTRRGAPARMERDIGKLVHDPAVQSHRFISHLQANKSAKLLDSSGRPFELDLWTIERFVPLTVVLDELGGVGSHFALLKEAGLLPPHAHAIAMSVTDVELIFELLPTTCEKIHYFVRRSELEQNTEYHADEADLLTFYLDTGFNIGATEGAADTMLEIRAISMKIDPYFTRGRLAAWKKPALRLTKWWRDIIDRIDERKAPGYTELGIRLLHVAYPEQAKLETGFARVRKAVKAKGTFGKHDSFIISFHGPPFRRHGVVLAAYDLKNRNERNDFLSHAVSIALEAETTVDAGAVVVGSFAPNPTYPYDMIGFFKARDQSGAAQT